MNWQLQSKSYYLLSGEDKVLLLLNKFMNKCKDKKITSLYSLLHLAQRELVVAMEVLVVRTLETKITLTQDEAVVSQWLFNSHPEFKTLHGKY